MCEQLEVPWFPAALPEAEGCSHPWERLGAGDHLTSGPGPCSPRAVEKQACRLGPWAELGHGGLWLKPGWCREASGVLCFQGSQRVSSSCCFGVGSHSLGRKPAPAPGERLIPGRSRAQRGPLRGEDKAATPDQIPFAERTGIGSWGPLPHSPAEGAPSPSGRPHHTGCEQRSSAGVSLATCVQHQ